MGAKGAGTVLVAILCITSLGLAGASIGTPGAGPAEALGGETDPATTDGDGSRSPGSETGTEAGGGNATGAASGANASGAGGTGTERAGASDAAGTPTDAERGPGGGPEGGAEREGSRVGLNGSEGDDGGESEPDGRSGTTPGGGGERVSSGSDGGLGGTSGGSYGERTSVGGPLELTDREELVVEAPEQSRWRLGGYATYTGGGWERDGGDPERVAGPVPTDGDADPEVAYEVGVTTRRDFESLVAAWRPAGAEADREVYVDENGGLTVDEAFAAGDTYSTATYGPPSREEAREADGGPYPDAVEERYTQLPADTPDRLERKTDNVTAGAGTTYEGAVAVESWLEGNKAYSLNASHDPDGDVVDEFVFEMDAGYCQYFATAMTVMLRTQGVPARYVTGYGPGEEIGDGEYLLRGRNAHAWVEVYFEGVGWVAFDPTPSDGRRGAGRNEGPFDGGGGSAGGDGGGGPRSNDQPEGEDADDDANDDGAETGSGGDTRDGDAGNGTDRDTDGAPETGTDDTDDAPVNVTVEPEPVPGREVAVTVTRGGMPVAGAAVRFDGEPEGVTDGSGTSTGEVPYDRRLNVTVRPGNASGEDAGAVNRTFELGTNISVSLSRGTVPGQDLAVRADIDGVPVADARVEVAGGTARTNESGAATLSLPFRREVEVVVTRGAASGTESLVVPHDLSLEVAGEPGAGTEIGVSVSLGGQPVPGARVELGDQSATTDGDGTATLALPFEGNVTVAAERGEFGDERTVALDTDLEVAVDGRVAPGFGITVAVANDGEPIGGVPVAFAGTEYATTGPGGETSFRPVAAATSATVVAERGAARGTAGPYALWPYWLLYATGIAVAALVIARRRGSLERARGAPEWVAASVRALAARIDGATRRGALAAVEVAVDAVGSVRRAVTAVRERTTAVAGGLAGTAVRGAGRLRGGLVVTVRRLAALGGLLRDPGAWRAALLTLGGLPGRIADAPEGSAPSRESVARDGPAGVDEAAVEAALGERLEDGPDEEDVDRFRRILEAWEELEAAAGRRPEWTPTELARRARRQGYPDRTVEELTRVFQRSRYGDDAPTPEMAAAAADAAETLTGEADDR